MDVHIRIWA